MHTCCVTATEARLVFPIVSETLDSIRLDDFGNGFGVSHVGTQGQFRVSVSTRDAVTDKEVTLGFGLSDAPELASAFSILVDRVSTRLSPCNACLVIWPKLDEFAKAEVELSQYELAWSGRYQAKMPEMRRHALMTQMRRIPVFADYELRNHWQVPILQVDLTRDSSGKKYLEFQSGDGPDFLEKCFATLKIPGVDSKLEHWTEAYETRWQADGGYG